MHLITSRATESRGYRESDKVLTFYLQLFLTSIILKETLNMRTTPTDSAALILLPFALFFVRVIGDGNSRTFMNLNGQKPQFISFDTKGGEVEVSIEVD